MIKVNLGCGTTCPKDWINIDNSLNAKLAKWPLLRQTLYKIGILPLELYEIPWETYNITIHDVRKKLPFNDNSVNYIFTSHLIEHLTFKESEFLLKECIRVLHPNGLIRISTPNLKLLVKNYLEEYETLGDNASDNFLSSLELVNKDSGIINYLHGSHKNLYDDKSLKKLLISLGFSNVEVMSYQKGNVPDLTLLDNRPNESMYIEAQKVED